MTVRLDLLKQVASGDVAAWQALLVQLMPLVTRHVRCSGTMRRSFRELTPGCDYVLDVCANVYGRLAERDFRNVRLFLSSAESLADPNFEAWLRKAIDFEIGDYVREKYGHTAARDDAGAMRRFNKRDVGSFASELPEEAGQPGQHSTLSGKLDSLRAVEYARSNFTPSEQTCFDKYLEDYSYTDIASAAGDLSKEQVEDVVRKLKERLRTRARHSARQPAPSKRTPAPAPSSYLA